MITDALQAARGGDELAFDRLVAPHRAELRAHCYRMLGSLHDAEDALQETLLRAWRGLARFEERSSLRSWLYRIATNCCLRLIERRPKRVLPLDYGPAADPHDPMAPPLVESVWVEPYPDDALAVSEGPAAPEARYEQREAIELAFVAALQYLPARQRAVLVLRDVLGFAPAEIAPMLDVSAAAVSSALQRAHKAVDERLPERSQQATLRALGDEALRAVVERYVQAWEAGDVDAIVAMLAEDAIVAMPPRPTWYRGREAIGLFLAARPLRPSHRWRVVPMRASGQLAFASYGWDELEGASLPHAVQVLTLDGDGRIADITSFLDAADLRRFAG